MHDIWGGKSSVYLSKMTIFNTVIPFLMHFFHISPYKNAPAASASNNVKPVVSQSEDTFHNDVGFATIYRRLVLSPYSYRTHCGGQQRNQFTVYRRIYCLKILTFSNRTSNFIRKCIRILVSLFDMPCDPILLPSIFAL